MRVNGGAAVMLDRHRADAMVSEEEGGRHADQAAADDENGDFDVRHRRAILCARAANVECAAVISTRPRRRRRWP